MDSNLNTSAYYSEEDSNTSSSQEELSKNNTAECNLRLRLFNRKPSDDAHEGAAGRAGADSTTMSKDPTKDIVQRILNQIQAGLDEVPPKMGIHRRTDRTSNKDAVEAVGPDTEDEHTQSTKQHDYSAKKEENAPKTYQSRQQKDPPGGFIAPGPHYLSRYDVVMVKILKGTTIDAERGVVIRCLPGDRYMVNVGTDNYMKHRTQLMPLTRKLTHDRRAMANYRPARAESKNRAPKAESRATALLDPEMEEHMLKLWKLRQLREDYRKNNSRQSRAMMDSEPKCPNMWHRLGSSIRQRTTCHRCPHHKGLEPIDEEGTQYDTDF